MNAHLATQTRHLATPILTPMRGVLQRACACGQHTGGGECEECRKKREGTLQRQATSSVAPNEAPPIVYEVLNLPGQPMDAATRAWMEPRFGHDFSRVRVHTDAKAAQSARAVSAKAYTVGQNVAFGMGEYAPETNAGRQLLAHELTHVVQQSGVGGGGPLMIGDATSSAEREAQRAATEASKTPVVETAPMTVQRQPQPPDNATPPNLGPPVQELPKPPRCSIIFQGGKWFWKCEGIPGLGSTPEIPLDPRDIPGRIKDLLPKGNDGPPPIGPKIFPVPPTPGSDLPPNWMEDICKRNPKSPLCITLGEGPTPNQPKAPDILARPIGVFWTTDVLFEHDQPSTQQSAPNGGVTAEGATALDFIIFALNSDPTLQVRLAGHTSSEGSTAHNQELAKRRAQLIYQKLEATKLSGRVMNPVTPDGKTDGCTRIDFGVWACGELQATQDETRPEERKVAVTFLRNPPLPSGPLKLNPPSLGGSPTR